MIKRFQRLFLGYEKAHGTYQIKGKNPTTGKVDGAALTIPSGATLLDYEAHLSGETGLGLLPLRADNTCYFGAIDIDVYNIDHKELQEKINKHKIPVVMFHTKSNGAHLYVFCSEAIDAQLLRAKMIGWAAKLGHGGCEIFPKQTYRLNDNDIGNWINIPYFMHDGTDRYAYNEKSEKLTFTQFLDFAESKFVTTSSLKSTFNEEEINHFKGAPPCLKQIHEDGGFPDGTRNSGLYNVAVYLKKRFPDDWQNHLPEYNTMMCNPVLPFNEVGVIVKSMQKKEYQYSCKQAPICNFCDKAKCLKQKFGVGNGGGGSEQVVEIGNITKYAGDPVIWMVEVDNQRVQLSTEDLYNQSSFAKICMERINRLPPSMPKPKWEQYISERLASMSPEDIINVPEDASAKGQFLYLFNMFCNSRVMAKTAEEMRSNKPWRNENKIHFSSRSLFEYLQTKNYKYKNEHAVWQMLRGIGADKGFMKIKGEGFNYWVVPAPDAEQDDVEQLNFKQENF